MTPADIAILVLAGIAFLVLVVPFVAVLYLVRRKARLIREANEALQEEEQREP